MIVRYDGTDYHGFQKQLGARTVQGDLERVFELLCGPGRVLGASRTDAGVHAERQVAVWQGPMPIPLERVAAVVNRRLPPAVRVVRTGWVPRGWDPRRQATAKQYSYRIWRGTEPPTIPWHRLVHVETTPLVWSRLVEGAAFFIGTHDFRAFRTEGSSAQTTVRTILASRWTVEEHGRIWRYHVIGTGFLYRMVRHMVGSMLAAAAPGGSLQLVAQGLSDVSGKVAFLAPPEGLTLDWIQYGHGEEL